MLRSVKTELHAWIGQNQKHGLGDVTLARPIQRPNFRIMTILEMYIVATGKEVVFVLRPILGPSQI